MSRKRFRVALSFPRGQRDYVEKVARALAERFAEEGVLYGDAETLIDACGYHRRYQELADARAVLG